MLTRETNVNFSHQKKNLPILGIVLGTSIFVARLLDLILFDDIFIV